MVGVRSRKDLVQSLKKIVMHDEQIKINITSLSPCIFLNLFKLSTLNNNQEIKK